MEKKLSKTGRVLAVYHLFVNCEEVAFREITDHLPVSKKTVCRDIRLLERAGILQVRYSKKREAFVPVSLELRPMEPEENKGRLRYMERLRRLSMVMNGLVRLEAMADWRNREAAPDPIEWYRANFPGVSDRTRQRDFAQLREIGYGFQYEPAMFGDPGYYQYDIPGTFILDDFSC